MAKIVQLEAVVVTPPATPEGHIIYAKEILGQKQVFTRAPDGTIYQLTPPVRAVLYWGADNINSTADTRWLWPGRGDTLAPLTDTNAIVMPTEGTIRFLFARHQAAVGNGAPVTYTVYKNGVATGITCNVPTNVVGQAFNVLASVPVSAGDRVSIAAIKPAAIGNGNQLVEVSLGFSL